MAADADAYSPTHPDPDPNLAPTLLGLTEGNQFWLRLASDDSLFCTVTATQTQPPTEHFDIAGRYELALESVGIDFRLVLRYRDADDGTASAESIDLRLVHGWDWSVPITPRIESISVSE